MILSVSGVSVSIRGRTIIADAGFTAARGELVVLVGPNGAGKTTLLKAIAQLLPSRGTVAFDGVPLAALTSHERAKRLAYLPQGHIAHWPISVWDVVAIGRKPTASSLASLPDEDHTAIEAALHATDALAFAHRPITELSGGERARVMLARALAAEAPLLLADEPVTSLDAAHQLEVMQLLSQTAKADRLVIAVIHDLTLAARFADRVLVLDQGRIAGDGPPDAVLTPALVSQVFRVETIRVSAQGKDVLLPWQPVA